VSAVASAPPDALALQHALDGRWRAIRDEVRDWFRTAEVHPPLGIDTDDYRAWVLDRLQELASGLGPQLAFPAEFGGQGDTGAAVTAFETLGHGDLSLLVKVGVQWGLFGGAVMHVGSREHHERHLEDIAALRLVGCFAMTETGHGSDVQSILTTATFDPESDEFVIHTPDELARKDYIGNAARDGQMAVVFAQLETGDARHGVHAFLVPIRDADGRPRPGVSIEDCGVKGGLNGVDNGRLRFDHVRVPRGALLDRFGQVAADGTYSSPIENPTKRFFAMLGTLVQGRVSVSGAAVSAAKSALTIAVRYGLERRQFRAPDEDREIPILDFLQHQRRLLPRLATTYAHHFAQAALVARLHAAATEPDYPPRERRKLESLAAGLKAATTWHATDTIQTCREACGGAGYLAENRLTQLKADTDVFTTFEGDNTVLLQLVAKGLLTNYRDEFDDLDTLGTIRYVADQVIETVVERMAARQLVQSLVDAVRGRDDEADLRDRGWHLELFEFREEHLLAGVARRIRSGVAGGQPMFEVFNSIQDHVLLTARAHTDRVVLEHFVEAIDECGNAEARAPLEQVADLYALANIEADRAWFLEHGHLSRARSKAVIAAVNDLCRELRPQARALVDAFAITDEALAAPIALAYEGTPRG
jgi:acyl-CoA oxidase